MRGTTWLSLLVAVLGAQVAFGADSITPNAPIASPTIHSLGIAVPYIGDDNGNAAATLEYKRSADPGWKSGHPFLRTPGLRLASSLFFLTPGTAYDFRISVTDPDGGSQALTGSATTRPEPANPAPLRTLYVSTTGSDNNNGLSPTAAFRTIQHAADASQPGDRIRVAPGIYRETVTVTRSGTPASPIVFESQEHATDTGSSPAILDGSEPGLDLVDATDNWLPDANPGIYYTTLSWPYSPSIPSFQQINPIHVARDTEEIYGYWYWMYDPAIASFQRFLDGYYCYLSACNSGETPDPDGCCPTNVAGGFYYDPPTRRLYVKLPDGSDPDLHPMHVVKGGMSAVSLYGANGFVVRGASHIVIRGFEVRYQHVGIWIHWPDGAGTLATGNVVEKNKIHNTATGVGVGVGDGFYNGNQPNVVNTLVQDNVVWNTKVAEWGYGPMKNNNAVESHGIILRGGRGSVVRRNTIHDVGNGIEMTTVHSPDPTLFNPDNDIYENTFYDLADDPIEPDGANMNIRVWKNRVYQANPALVQASGSGVSASPNTVGPTWILYNTFLDGKQGAFKLGGNALTFGPILIYHNTVYSDIDELVTVFGINPPTPGLQITTRNNIFMAAGPRPSGFGDNVLQNRFSDPPEAPLILDFDYDNLFTTRMCGASLCRLAAWLGNHFTLASFQAASGLEPNALSVDPLFLNIAANDASLQAASPLVDRGLRIPGINDGFAGSAPDLGAHEFVPPTGLAGDVDNDGAVTLQDLLGAAADFRRPPGSRQYPGSGPNPGSDVTQDGQVDIRDLVRVAQAIVG